MEEFLSNFGVFCLGSVHLSLPTGRFMVRDLRYHSSNQTFRVVRCQISWRYWIRRVAEEEDFEDDREGEGERASGESFAYWYPQY